MQSSFKCILDIQYNTIILTLLYKILVSHLDSLPPPLSVLGVVCESPHVHVALDDLWSEDVVSVTQSGGCGFSSTVESKCLRSQFGG